MWVHDSAWKYETSATGGAGIAFVAGSGGALYLTDPAGQPVTLHFGGIGVGWSFGFKIPKVPKVQLKGKSVAGAGSAKAFPSIGKVFKADRLGARDLTRDDLNGAILFVEGALGLVAGGAGDAMLFGINSLRLVAALGSPGGILMSQAIESAAGAITFVGANVGVQAGGGVAGLIGYMH